MADGVGVICNLICIERNSDRHGSSGGKDVRGVGYRILRGVLLVQPAVDS